MRGCSKLLVTNLEVVAYIEENVCCGVVQLLLLDSSKSHGELDW